MVISVNTAVETVWVKTVTRTPAPVRTTAQQAGLERCAKQVLVSLFKNNIDPE